MDFELSEEQKMFRDSVRGFAEGVFERQFSQRPGKSRENRPQRREGAKEIF